MRRRGVCPGIPQRFETRPLFSDRPYDIKEVTCGRPPSKCRVSAGIGFEFEAVVRRVRTEIVV
jgi:hypothetical protein